MKRTVVVLIPLLLLPGAMQHRVPVAEDARLSVSKPAPAVRITKRTPNRQGEVLVLMYHRVEPVEKKMVRSIKNFKADLNRLYSQGFRPVTLNEYVTNTMQLPSGASPVVITWDDSHPTQFQYRSDGTIDPDCAVGIWADFAKSHPDFPVKGTFFILPNGPFGQKLQGQKKIDQLKEWGSEIGSHTMNHHDLRKLTDEQVISELARSYDYIASLGIVARSFAMPYGSTPKNRGLMEKCEFGGKTYGYDSQCLAGAGPAPSPLSKSFDQRRIPRIQAYDGPLGVSYWLNRSKSGECKVYVQP